MEITKELLEILYVERELSSQQIAKILNVSKDTVLNALSKFDIKRRGPAESQLAFKKHRVSEDIITKELLEQLYIKDRLSSREIGKMLGLGDSAILGKLNKFNIPRRSLSEALRNRAERDLQELDEARLEGLRQMMDNLESVPEVQYQQTVHDRIYVSLPLNLIGIKGKEPITLTLALSDLHLGDANFLGDTYWSVIAKVEKVLKQLKIHFDIKSFKVVLNGDIVSGREVFKYQEFQNLLQRGNWQVFLAEALLKDTFQRLSQILSIDSVYLVRGTHESYSSENYMLYLKRVLSSNGFKCYYLGHGKTVNIASPIGNYNILFTHGKGASDYYPISPSMIREIWKIVNQSKLRNIPIEEVCLSHTHWLSTNLMLEGITISVTGGFQKWEKTIAQRPCGVLLYIYHDNEASVMAVRPDEEVENKEKIQPDLEYKNLKYYGNMLMRHFKEIERHSELDYENI